jgi:hypothetical protein
MPCCGEHFYCHARRTLPDGHRRSSKALSDAFRRRRRNVQVCRQREERARPELAARGAARVLVAAAVAGTILAGAAYWFVAHRRTDGAQAGVMATRPARPAGCHGGRVPIVGRGPPTRKRWRGHGQRLLRRRMTDALITRARQGARIRVTPRASAFALKGATLSTRQVGETLHVATVLEGSEQRAGDRLRVAVQLTDPARDSMLWSERLRRQPGRRVRRAGQH